MPGRSVVNAVMLPGGEDSPHVQDLCVSVPCVNGVDTGKAFTGRVSLPRTWTSIVGRSSTPLKVEEFGNKWREGKIVSKGNIINK